MTIFARLIIRLLACYAVVCAVTGAETLEFVQPSPGEVIPRDHEVQVVAMVPVAQAAIQSHTVTVSVGGGGAQPAFSSWVENGTNQLSQPVALLKVTFPASAFGAVGNQSVAVTIAVDSTDGDTDADWAGTLTWNTAPDGFAQPLVPFLLPILSGADRAEVYSVRRQDASVVLAGGQSLFNAGEENEYGEATLWRFTGSAIETIDVQASLEAAAATLNLGNVVASQVSLVNGTGAAVGLAIGPRIGADGDGIAGVAWLRESNGIIRLLADVSVGSFLDAAMADDEFPEISGFADNGWVVLVTNNHAPVNANFGGAPETIPGLRALACRWNGTSVDTIDLHAEFVVAAGVTPTSTITWVNGLRNGTGNNLGQVWMQGLDDINGGAMRPTLRLEGGTHQIASVTTLDPDSDLSWMSADGTRGILGAYSDEGDTAYAAAWNNGAYTDVTQVPSYFSNPAEVNELFGEDAVDTSVSTADLLLGSEVYGAHYRSWLQPFDAAAGTFGTVVHPEWLVPNALLRDGSSSYLWLNFNALDGVGTDRVYVGEGWGWGETKAVLLVHTDRITSAASSTDVAFAWPVTGQQLPAGHQFPTGLAISGLPEGMSITSVQYAVTLPSASPMMRSINQLDNWGPAWRTDWIAGDTTGAASASAVITYSDGSIDNAAVSFSISAAPTPEFNLTKLPLPSGYGEARVESVSTNGLYAAGYAEDDSQPTVAVLWSNLNGSPAVEEIDPSAMTPTLPDGDVLASWARLVNSSGLVVGFVEVEPFVSPGTIEVYAWARLSGESTIRRIALLTSYSESADDPDTLDWFALADNGLIVGQKEISGKHVPHSWLWNGSSFTETNLLAAIDGNTANAIDAGSTEAISPDGSRFGGGYGLMGGTTFFPFASRVSGTWDVTLPIAADESFVVDITNSGQLVAETDEEDTFRRRAFIGDNDSTSEILPLHSTGGVAPEGINDQGTVVGEQIYHWNGEWDLASAFIKTSGGPLTPLTWLVSPAQLDAAVGTTGDQWHANLWWAAGISDGTSPVVVANGDGGPYLLRPAVNAAPVLAAIGDRSTAEDTNLVFTVSATDADVTDTLIFSTSGATNGSAVVVGNQITFTPTLNFYGTAGLTITVSDGTATDSETIAITVTPVNDGGPVIQTLPTLTGTIGVGQTFSGTSGTWSDVDNDSITYTYQFFKATNGSGANETSVSGPGLSSPSYVAQSGDTYLLMEVTASDGALTGVARSSWVRATNTVPEVTGGQTGSGDEDAGAIIVNLAATDADGDSLTFALGGAVAPTDGTASISGTQLTFTPAVDRNGTINIPVTAVDPYSTSAPVDVVITVTAVNDPPVNTVLPVVTMSGNDAVATNGTWNDIKDGGGTTITYTYAWYENNVGSGDGTLLPGQTAATLVDAALTHLYVRCEVTATDDGTPGTANATATSTWLKTNNQLPVITPPGTLNAVEDTVASDVLQLNATDPDGDAASITWSVFAQPVGGTVTFTPTTGASTTLSFTPSANVNGADSVVMRATDTEGGITDVTITIAIVAVNDAPSFVVGSDVTVDEDSGASSTSAWAGSIAAGPANEAAQAVTFTVLNDNNALFSVQPAIAANGTLTFTPAADANGSALITVFIADDGGTANGGVDTSANQTATITVTAVNDPPLATAGGVVTVDEDSAAYGAAWATAISAGPADESPQTVSFALSGLDVGELANFTVTPAISPTGVLTFTPAPDANGTITATVTPSDSGGANGAPLDLTIILTAVNDPPVNTVSPLITIVPGAPATANASTGTWNDIKDGNPAPVIFAYRWFRSAEASGSNPTLIAGETAESYTVDGAQDFYLQVEVTATDAGTPGTADGVALSAWTRAVNLPPVADSSPAGPLAVLEDTPAAALVTLTVTSDDATPLADHTWSIQTQGAKGSVTLSAATGASITASYAPNSDATGSDMATVRVTDGDGGYTDLPLSFAITAINDAPLFTAGADVTVDEDSGAYSAAWATGIAPGPVGAIDEAGQLLTFSVVASNTALFSVQPAIAANGTLSFTPAANASGSSTITVTLSDDGSTANGGVDTTAPQIATITVTGINDPPQLVAGPLVFAHNVNEDAGVQQVEVAMAATGIAPGPADESAQSVVSATRTSLTNASLFLIPPRLVKDGSTWELTYAATANASGTATAQFAFTDDGTAPATSGDLLQIDITVTAVNDPPRFTAGPGVVVVAGQTANISGWATDISPGGGVDESAQTVSFVVTHGGTITAATLSPNGDLSVTAGGAGGSTNLSVVANDSAGGSSVAISVPVTIVPVDTLAISAPSSVSVAGWDGDDSPLDFDDTTPNSVVIPVQVAYSGAEVVTVSATGVQPGSVRVVAGVIPSFTVTYTPPEGFAGVDTLTVTATAGVLTQMSEVAVYVTRPVEIDLVDSGTATPTAPPDETPVVDGDPDTPDSDHTIDADPQPVAEFSLLAVPAGAAPLTLSDLGITRLVVTYDPVAGDWRPVAPDEVLDAFTGYWIEPGPALDLPTIVAAPVTRMEKTIQLGWNAFAVPVATPVAWDTTNAASIAVRVTDGSGSTLLTVAEAYAAGYVEHVAWCLGASGYVPVVDPATVAQPGATQTNQIQAGKSYLFRVLNTTGVTLTLVIAIAPAG